MKSLSGKTVVVGITGGIAGYKMLELLSNLKKEGAKVEVILTSGALSLFGKTLFEKAGVNVWVDTFEKDIAYEHYTKKKRKIPHIVLADNADLILIVPATANIISKLANGIADDLLTTTLLAAHAPVLIAPSMNVKMLSHPATEKNLETLRDFGYSIIEPDYGDLACGYRGMGRLPNREKLLFEITSRLEKTQALKEKTVVVTAGATIETIDPVRVITNRSSGKTGRAIAEEAYKLGANVVYLHGKHAVTSRYLFEQISFTTGRDLEKKLKEKSLHADIIIHAAAVGDFRLEKPFEKKISSDKELTLRFSTAPKILEEIKKWNKKVFLVGFKAEFGVSKKRLIEKAKETLRKAHADLIVANDVSKKNAGFDAEKNEVVIVGKNGNVTEIPLAEKYIVAQKIWDLHIKS